MVQLAIWCAAVVFLGWLAINAFASLVVFSKFVRGELKAFRRTRYEREMYKTGQWPVIKSGLSASEDLDVFY